MRYDYLLIAPEGIEISVRVRKKSCMKLLIAPEGIEIDLFLEVATTKDFS